MRHRWGSAAIASGACLGAGTALLVTGLFSHRPVLALLGSVLIGAWAGSAAAVAHAWLDWHRAHGSQVCLTCKKVHLHWPRGKRADCRRLAGFHADLRQQLK